MRESEPLLTELREAERTLKDTLQEACGTDVARADTGQLIKVEEMLAIASDAAKQAISIRRKRKLGTPPATAPGVAPDAGMPLPSEHRSFTDETGTEWTVRAFHPADRVDARHARLLGAYQQGWLSFESEATKRRLSPIPDDWTSVDEATLRVLCSRAEEATTRR